MSHIAKTLDRIYYVRSVERCVNCVYFKPSDALRPTRDKVRANNTCKLHVITVGKNAKCKDYESDGSNKRLEK